MACELCQSKTTRRQGKSSKMLYYLFIQSDISVRKWDAPFMKLYRNVQFAREYIESCRINAQYSLLCWMNDVAVERFIFVSTCALWQGPRTGALWLSGQISVRTILNPLQQHLHIEQQSTLDTNNKNTSCDKMHSRVTASCYQLIVFQLRPCRSHCECYQLNVFQQKPRWRNCYTLSTYCVLVEAILGSYDQLTVSLLKPC